MGNILLPVVQNPTSATNLVVQKLKQDLLVKILGQTANTLTFTANVLPSTSVDPRYNNGKELAKIKDGSNYSGTYLVTEVTTTYSNGTRARTISGVGHSITGANNAKLVDVSKKSAKSTLGKKSTGSKSKSTKSHKKPSKKPKKPSSHKSTAPKKEMYYKNGKWYNA